MDNSNYLDLDALSPSKLYVVLGGEKREVYQPTVKQIIELEKQFSILAKQGEKASDLSMIKDLMAQIMPSIKEDGVDLNVSQMVALIEFVVEKATGVKPTTEKKTQEPKLATQ